MNKNISDGKTKTNFKEKTIDAISPRPKTARLAIAVLIIGMTIALISTAYHPDAYAKLIFHHNHKNKNLNLEPGQTKNVKCKGSSGDVTLAPGTTLKACGKSFHCKQPSDSSSSRTHHHSHFHCAGDDSD